MKQESPTSLLPILCKGISQQLSYHVIHNRIKATTVHNRLFPSEDGVTRIHFNDKNKNPKIHSFTQPFNAQDLVCEPKESSDFSDFSKSTYSKGNKPVRPVFQLQSFPSC